jgi:hypothetical protein
LVAQIVEQEGERTAKYAAFADAQPEVSPATSAADLVVEQNFRASIQKWISDRADASSAAPLDAAATTSASSSSSEVIDRNRTETDPDVLDLVVSNGFYRKVVYALVSREFPSLFVEKFQAATGGRAHMRIKAISPEEQLQRRRAKIEAQKQAFDQKVAHPFPTLPCIRCSCLILIHWYRVLHMNACSESFADHGCTRCAACD